jgi:cytochrome P450
MIVGSILTIAAINARPLWNRVCVEKQSAVEPTTELKPSNPAPTSTPISAPTPQSDILARWKVAKQQTTRHRTDEKFYPPDVPIPIVSNRDFFDCDPNYSKLFHNLAAHFFSGGNLKQYEPMMREKASQLLRNELSIDFAIDEYLYQMFCEIMFGCQGRYENDRRPPKDMGALLLPRSDPKKFLAAIQDTPQLSDEQVHNFIAVMWERTYSLANEALHHEIIRACCHRDLQDKAFNTVDQKDLDDQILRFIIEDHRMHPSLSDNIERGPNLIIMKHKDFANKEEIVGANPETFNPNRYKKLPNSWYGLPWRPFGDGGCHRCPGMKFHQYLSKQFLTELFLNYRIDGIDKFGKVITDDMSKIRKARITSRRPPKNKKFLASTFLYSPKTDS